METSSHDYKSSYRQSLNLYSTPTGMAFVCRRLPFVQPAALKRSFATAANQASSSGERFASRTEAVNPPSKTYYTARSAFYDCVENLELAINHSRNRLKTLQLLPLPEFAIKSLPPLVSVWKTKEDLSTTISSRLSASRHRRLIELLNELNHFRRIAETAGHHDLGYGISDVLEIFERPDKEEHLRRGHRKPVEFDEHGRSYTSGKRKTSSARVWMISSEHATLAKANSDPSQTVPVTEVLVNNVPFHKYFTVPSDRERILRPLQLTGLLGAFNVFALVRGGGISGQSGAIAHGVAKALAAHVPDVELILRRGKCLLSFFIRASLNHVFATAKMLRRDPRMVERKKTGLAKARKAVRYKITS